MEIGGIWQLTRRLRIVLFRRNCLKDSGNWCLSGRSFQSSTFYSTKNCQLNEVYWSTCKAKDVMDKFYEGVINIDAHALDLDQTLLGGQSFRWEKSENVAGNPRWLGVAYGAYWELQQTPDSLLYRVYPGQQDIGSVDAKIHFNELLSSYFRLDFDLVNQIEQWRKCHKHFDRITTKANRAVRVLAQEPLENIISFICSQNNNISRITSLIKCLCSKYGKQIYKSDSGEYYYAFPTLESLMADHETLAEFLRQSKFGYRAKYVANSIGKINEFGGEKWFQKLRSMTYQNAREELLKLPGIGHKVADCICLMSLQHLDAVPIDTHIYKIARTEYLPQLPANKNLTTMVYERIANHFRQVYGPFAGWAQAVLFCSELGQFREEDPPAKHGEKRTKLICKFPIDNTLGITF